MQIDAAVKELQAPSSCLAIIAGGGDFPRLIAQAAKGEGIRIAIIGVRGFADEALSSFADAFEWVELGQIDLALRLMKKHGATHVILAGRVPHTSIFQYRHFDWRAIKLLARAANKKADSLLGTLTQELENEGFVVLDSSLLLKSLMPAPGLLTPHRPLSEAEAADIEFAFPIAKVVAGQDIGQTIVVKDKMVVAVEAAEGTDECILRAGSLAGPGCVVVKVSKPQQDLRFDIPVIGRRTIETMLQAGATVLAISARECLVFDREEVVRKAEEYGIAIVAR